MKQLTLTTHITEASIEELSPSERSHIPLLRPLQPLPCRRGNTPRQRRNRHRLQPGERRLPLRHLCRTHRMLLRPLPPSRLPLHCDSHRGTRHRRRGARTAHSTLRRVPPGTPRIRDPRRQGRQSDTHSPRQGVHPSVGALHPPAGILGILANIH